MRSAVLWSILCLSFSAQSCAHARRFDDRVVTRKSSYRTKPTQEIRRLSMEDLKRLRGETRAWRWPLADVTVTSNFGGRDGSFHDGIDLRAPVGTAVYAAADGVVIYAGNRIRGYGNMVVLRHANGLSTVYAHNSVVFARKGQKVRRGSRIAFSGNTGHSSGPHVHFEVRKGITAINPASLLVDPSVVREANRRIAARESRRMKRQARN